jgi:hypothetical protein
MWKKWCNCKLLTRNWQSDYIINRFKRVELTKELSRLNDGAICVIIIGSINILAKDDYWQLWPKRKCLRTRKTLEGGWLIIFPHKV